MQINCINGYYKFYVDRFFEIDRVYNLYNIELVPRETYFIPSELSNVPSLSIEGADFMGNTATATYSGAPENIFLANNLVFELASKTVKSLESINLKNLRYAENNTFMQFFELIQAGWSIDSKKRIRSYIGFIDFIGTNIIGVKDLQYYG